MLKIQFLEQNLKKQLKYHCNKRKIKKWEVFFHEVSNGTTYEEIKKLNKNYYLIEFIYQNY